MRPVEPSRRRRCNRSTYSPSGFTANGTMSFAPAPAQSPLDHFVFFHRLSVSSNYQAACRARSRAEFIAKLGLVLEEADESEHWFNVLHEGRFASGPELEWLRAESAQL